jgi:hypothetical protein
MSTTKLISTDRELLGLQPNEAGRYDVYIKSARGLAIRVYPSGEKVFEVRYVAANGSRRRMKLGTYPALKLADAKIQAGKFQNEVVEGRDPRPIGPPQRRSKGLATRSRTWLGRPSKLQSWACTAAERSQKEPPLSPTKLCCMSTTSLPS